jgi:hypothetical protein
MATLRERQGMMTLASIPTSTLLIAEAPRHNRKLLGHRSAKVALAFSQAF